ARQAALDLEAVAPGTDCFLLVAGANKVSQRDAVLVHNHKSVHLGSRMYVPCMSCPPCHRPPSLCARHRKYWFLPPPPWGTGSRRGVQSPQSRWTKKIGARCKRWAA
ncbi:unnamed protein product, partial [Ectocarpus sp. 8 AP-2014]